MEKSSFGDAVVIINCSTERKDQVDNPKTGILVNMHFYFSFWKLIINLLASNWIICCLGLIFLLNSSQTVVCTKDC